MFDYNPYYNPEKLDLEILCTLDEAISYEFNMLVVWRHLPTGKLYWATDSGCSCPTPFENHCSLDSLNSLGNVTEWMSFERAVRDFPVPAHERQDLLSKARRGFKGR